MGYSEESVDGKIEEVSVETEVTTSHEMSEEDFRFELLSLSVRSFSRSSWSPTEEEIMRRANVFGNYIKGEINE